MKKKITDLKKILFARLAVLSLLLGSTAMTAAQSTISIGDISVAPNGEAEVTISIKSAVADIWRLEGDIDLPDGLKFKVVDGKAEWDVGEISSGMGSTLKPSNGHFSVRDMSSTTHTGFSDTSGSIFKFTVVGTSDLPATSAITVTNVVAMHLDGNEENIAEASNTVTRISGGGGGDDPTPTTTSATLSFSTPEIALSAGQTAELAVTMDNTVDILAFEGLLTLPDNITANVIKGAATNSNPSYNKTNKKIVLADFSGIKAGTGNHLLTIVLTAGSSFSAPGTVTLSNITMSGKDAAISINPDDITVTVKVKDEATYNNLKAMIAELQTKLDKAKEDYPTIDFKELQDRITDLSTKLESSSSIDADAIKTEIKAINDDIDQKILDATKTSLEGKITELNTAFDALAEEIKTKLKLGETYESELNDLKNSILTISTTLNEQYKTGTINEEDIQKLIDEAAEWIETLRAKAEAKAAANGVTMTLSKNSITMAAGATADIEVSMNNAGVTVTNFSAKLELPEGWSAETKENKNRMINIGSYTEIKGSYITGESGTLFTITLTAPANFTGSAEINLTNISATVNGTETTLPNKKLTVEAGGSGNSGVTWSFAESEITAEPSSTVTVAVNMDNAGVTVKGFSAVPVLPTGWTYTAKESERLGEGDLAAKEKIVSYGGVSGTEGTIFTLSLTIPAGVYGQQTVKLTNINATVNGVNAKLDDIALTVNLKDTKVYEALKEKIKTLSEKLTEAENTLKTQCPDVDCENDITSLRNRITDLGTDLDKAYDAAKAIDQTDFEKKIDAISADINKMVEKAKADQLKIIREKLQKGIDTAKAELTALEAYIEGKGKTDTYSSQLSELQATIIGIGSDLTTAYNAGSIDEAAIQKDIDKVRADIAALKAEVEKELDTTTYDQLAKEIADLQTQLSNAEKTIANECPYVGDYSAKVASLQSRITSLENELKPYKDSEISDAEKTAIETKIKAVSADIEAMLKEALAEQKVKQKKHDDCATTLKGLKEQLEAEKLKIAADYTSVYSSMKDDFDAIQSQIEALRTQLEADANNGKLTESYSLDTTAIETAIGQLVPKAQLLTLYNKVKAKINDVQAELDAVNTYVKTYCKDKDYTSDITALQNRINTVSSDLETAKSKGSISEADFTATLNTISSDIAKLKAKAAAEQSSSQSISPDITALYQSWAEKIAAVQKKLKDAVEKIRDTYPASTVEAMEPEISAVQEKLAQVSSQLDDLYYSQKLTDKTTFDLDSIEKAIDALTASAKTKNDAINTSTYNTLKAEIDALQKQLDDTKADIKKNCDDAITATAETDAKAIQTQIDQLKANLDALNKAGKLGADSKLDAAATKAVTDAIADMYFKAIKTQNDKAYPVLVKEIEALSDSLDTARKQIEEAYGEEIATAMAEALDAIQKKIDEAKAALDKQHANILITKNTTVDKETILAAISKAKADAKAKAEPESPDKPDDPEDPDKPDSHSKEAQALYKALTADLAALQRQLDNAKAEMERKYDKDIVEAGKKDFEDLQKMIDEMKAKIEELYKADKLDKNTEIDKDEFAAALNKAKDATKALQAEKNYKAMTEEIAKLEAELAKAKEEVEKNAADVAEEFNLQFSLIEQLLAKLKDQVEKEQKEGMVSMNNMASADIIRNSIGNVTKDAAKREEAFQANKKLTEKLDEVDNLLNTTMEQIQKDYANVAGDFADDMARIQAMIDALRAELRQKYLDGELNANSSIDTTAIRNAITALLKAAKDAHTVGIFGITMPEGATTEMYDLNGQRISQPKKGTVIIVRMQDGKLRKMVVR